MIPVLYVTAGGRRVYGGERWIVNLCRYLDPDRYKAVVALHTVGELWDTLGELDVQMEQQRLAWLRARPPWEILSSPVEVAWAALRLAWLVRKTGSRLIHIFDARALQSGFLAGMLCQVPVVVTIQLVVRFPRLESLILSRASRIVAVSKACGRELVACGVPEDRLVDIPTGIQLEAYLNRDGEAIRRELQIAAHVPLVGIVASLQPNKRHDLFLRAAALIRDRHPTACFVIVGDDKGARDGRPGEYRQYLEKLVCELNLNSQVIFAGFRHDIPDVLASLDVFVLCSDQEALPVSIMEAMASSKPVVATRVGGVVDLVGDDLNGFLVPPGDASALARSVGRLLTDPELACRMGEMGRHRAMSKWSVQDSVCRNQVLYDTVLAEWGKTH